MVEHIKIKTKHKPQSHLIYLFLFKKTINLFGRRFIRSDYQADNKRLQVPQSFTKRVKHYRLDTRIKLRLVAYIIPSVCYTTAKRR